MWSAMRQGMPKQRFSRGSRGYTLSAFVGVVWLAGCGLVLDTDPSAEVAEADGGVTGIDAANADGGAIGIDAGHADAPAGPADGSAVDGTAGSRDAAVRDATGNVDASPPACAPLPSPSSATGPLAMTDLTDIDACGAPSLDVGFRCKSYVFCGASQPCYYAFEDSNLGHLQSSEARYYDGTELPAGEPTVFVVGTGADSLCMDPVITIDAGDFLRVRDGTGRELDVWLPNWTGRNLRLYVGVDGRTYWDESRTMLAGAPP